MMSSRFACFLVILFMVFWVAPAVAQTVTGTILGNVIDPSGASIPDAKVTVTNNNTGLERVVSTNALGTYVAPFLPVGTYTVTIESTGFQGKSLTDIVLQVDDQLRLDVSLELGAVTEVVEVTGAAPLLQTENASMGDVITTQKVLTLPLVSRDYLALALLTPGVSRGGTRGNGLSINGGRGDFNSYVVDGSPNTSRFSGGVVLRPNIDAIQEFKVQTSTYSAEFGFAGNGQINLVTKSGANQLHGSAYEFLRNSELNARGFFDPGGPILPLKRNQFGFTVGGPIVRNSTFFFGEFEGLRLVRNSSRLSLIPTQDLKNGNFQGRKPVYDVLTFSEASGESQPFPNNIIPASRISSVAQGLNEFYPEPNQADPRRNYNNTASREQNDENFGIRIDQHFSSSNQLSFAYRISDSESISPGNLPVLTRFSSPRPQLATLSDTHVFSPQIINELRLGFNRVTTSATSERTFNDDVAGSLGIGGISDDPYEFGFPSISLINFAGVSDPGNPFPTLRIENVFMVGDTVSITKGAHSFKFGGQVHKVQLNNDARSWGRGGFTFDGRFTRRAQGDSSTGDDFADYMLGLPWRTRRQVGGTRVDMRSSYFGGFIQDDWKVNPRLTVNLGLRYELNTPMADQLGRNSNVDYSHELSAAAVVLPGEIGPVTGQKYGEGLYEGDYNNWGPRVGLAFRPFGGNKTVLRTGYGVFYVLSPGRMITFNAQNPPRIVNETFTAEFPDPTLSFQDPFFLEGQSISSRPVSVRGIERNRRDAYIQQWNFTIQQQLSDDLMIETAYVGTTGTKLSRTGLPNIPTPGPGPIQPRRPFEGFATFFVREARMSSNYHSLQFKVDKRFKNGLTFVSGYTYAHSIDNGSSSFGGGGNSPDNAQNPLNHRADRGNSRQDVRHRYVISYIYELPFGNGRRFGTAVTGFLNQLIGGWQIAGITTFQTGLNNSGRVRQDRCNCDRAGRMRPDATGQPQRLDNPTPDRYFNTDAFVLPAEFTFGNSGRGVIAMPGINNFDFSIQKNLFITEGHKLQFRSEFFNTFNHTQFGQPNTDVDRTNYGRISSLLVPARQIQLGLRYEF